MCVFACVCVCESDVHISYFNNSLAIRGRAALAGDHVRQRKLIPGPRSHSLGKSGSWKKSMYHDSRIFASQ